MPPFSKIAALLLLLAGPAGGLAQTYRPAQPIHQNPGYPRHVSAPPAPYDFSAGGPVRQASYQAPAPAPVAAPPRVLPTAQPTPVRLSPPSRANSTSPIAGNKGLPSVATVIGGLAIVLGIFFLVAWGMRRAAPAGSGALPGEVFELLGRAPLGGRQQAHLLRCGTKLVLVSVTPSGAETITEITDPVEVDRLAGLCRQAQPNSATAVFRQVLDQVTRHGVENRSVENRSLETRNG